ncbi:MAG TPA: nucleotide exchange factor GrpE [Verrucomicrobiae bacterium]|nr:nucleotide exchange factor GrpE [Verrucomicrobiae bacterium]
MKKSETHAHKPETDDIRIASAAGETADETLVAVPTKTEQKIADLEEQVAKAKDNWIRTAADFENFKKRAARERTEATQFANAALLQKLLPILDNFEMAQVAAQSAQGDSLESLQSGVAMIQQQLKTILADSGLEEINAGGKLFDPTLHEAVSQQETAEVPENHVLQQIRKGYKLRDRLLRPAAVIVAKNPAANS